MTTRYHSLTVVLDRDIREDDAEHIMHAIRMLKGVIDVTGKEVTTDSYMAESRAKADLREKVYKALE